MPNHSEITLVLKNFYCGYELIVYILILLVTKSNRYHITGHA